MLILWILGLNISVAGDPKTWIRRIFKSGSLAQKPGSEEDKKVNPGPKNLLMKHKFARLA